MAQPVSTSSSLLVEFTECGATIVSRERSATVALEYGTNGALTPEARAVLREAVSLEIEAASTRPIRAVCLIGARGVSLRRLKIPAAKPEQLRQMLSIQIEREFPLSPDELAWGFQVLSGGGNTGPTLDVLLVAVKKELIADRSAVFAELQMEADFSVGILAIANDLARTGDGNFAVLKAGERVTELVLCEDGVPSMIRVLPEGSSTDPASLAERLKRLSLPGRVFVSRPADQGADWERSLQASFNDLDGGHAVIWKPAPTALEAGAAGDAARRVSLRVGATTAVAVERKRVVPLKWVLAAAALFVGLLAMRYVEPVLKKAALEERIAEVTTARESLPPIEEELEFLRYLEKSRPAYLDAVTVLADSIPSGAKFDSLTLTRQGEFSFRVTLRTQQEATALREKMLASGLFSRVVLDEQTPTGQQSNQKLSTRVSARWIPTPSTPSKVIEKIVNQAAPAEKKG